ncbi:MAG: M4 family metallopeptidase [Thermoleophilia bacterium]|nr:M4 family metallopeptidase [Thermoleophilia bacterium]
MTMNLRPIAATATKSSLVVAHDGTGGREQLLTPQQVEASNDQVLKATVENASKVMSFLKEKFGRDGLDGKGQKLDVVVHAQDPMMGGGPMNNAYWDGQAGKMFIGDGDGHTFTPLGEAIDIIAHEAGHAVLESEVKMGFGGQEGALHESFGDVLGSLLDPDDWQVGEDAFTPGKAGDALRDMSKPTRYSNMSEVRGNGGEPHLLADIPNLAAVRVAEKIGRQEMGKVWYDGFTEYMKDHAQFADAAVATVKAAEQLYGVGSSQAAAVTDAWTSVGVLGGNKAAAA